MVKDRKRSVVWGFFKNIDSQSVRCLLCRCYLRKKGNGSTTHMLRHLRVSHPTELSSRINGLGPEAGTSSDHQDKEADGDHFCSVEVALEDDESDSVTTEISSSVNGFMDAPHGGPVEIITHIEASDERPVRRPRHRSVIWRHFKRLDSMNAVSCCICMTKLVESGGISNLRRHLSTRHPEVYSELLSNQQHPSPSFNFSQDSNAETDEAFWATEQSPVPEAKHPTLLPEATSVIHENTAASPAQPQRWSKCSQDYVEVVLKDRDSEEVTAVKETDNGSAGDDIPDASHEGPAEPQTHTEASNNRPAGRTQRSMIWRHFERLDSLNAARCRICMKKLKCGKNSTSNLHRHMSKRHPKMLSELVSSGLQLPPLNCSQVSHSNSEMSEQRPAPDAMKVVKVSEGDRRVLKRERELIEALRRTQKEEARTLEHQRELLEKLRTASAREAAAEREEIQSLRKAQQEEAKDLSKQREELQKEKAELQKKWKELQQEREELLLFSRGQQVS